VPIYDPQVNYTAAKSGYWATQSKVSGTSEQVQPENTLACWDVTHVFTRTTPAGTREDVATFGLRIAKIAGTERVIGLTSELTTIEGFLNTFNGTLGTIRNAQTTLAEYAWHERRANHPVAEGGGEKVGPAIKRTTKSTVGGMATGRMPDQIAMSVTLKTASRRHWGRFYIPGIDYGNVDTTYGRFTAAACDIAAAATNPLAVALDGAGFRLGVWSYPKQAFMDVDQIQVDNIPDVQRRRRAKQRSYAKTYG
jgi:hypothetical protein